ncbi:hypothetical protein DFH27DRAFT_559779 [Peziza echinospora]|nr:hypothetical protein DFH27DRAFT_559779 [Peziza echinospora]
MEERLVYSGGPGGDEGEEEEEEGGERRKEVNEKEGSIHEKVLRDIEAAYQAYLETREKLVGLVGQFHAPSSTTSTSKATSQSQTQSPTTGVLTPSPNTLPKTPTLPLLSLLTDHLPQLTHLQKSLHNTKNHLSTTLLRSKDSSTHTLLQLSRSSQVLTEAYDISGVSQPLDLLRLWHEAVRIRKARLAGDVLGRMDEAGKGLEGGVKAVIGDLEGLMEVEFSGGGASGVEGAGGERDEKKGIPVRSGIGKGKRGGGGDGGRQEKKGLWSGLDGGIGVIGDGI